MQISTSNLPYPFVGKHVEEHSKEFPYLHLET